MTLTTPKMMYHLWV